MPRSGIGPVLAGGRASRYPAGNFFPSVDAGQIRLHMRAPTGTRIEEIDAVAEILGKLPGVADGDDSCEPN